MGEGTQEEDLSCCQSAKYKNLSFLFEDNNKVYTRVSQREDWWLGVNRGVF